MSYINTIDLHIMGHWISPPGTLGGTTRILIEFVKRWCLDPDITITIHTSAEGAKTLEIYEVPQKVRRFVWQGVDFSWSFNPLNHTRQVLAAIENISMVRVSDSKLTLIYSATEFWPDVIPATLLRRRIPESRWLAGFFLFAPAPSRGYEGMYGSREFIIPDWRLVFNKYFYQRFSLYLIDRFADMLFITNESDSPYFLNRGFSSTQIRAIYGGVDLAEVCSVVPPKQTDFAACFVGRLHPQKGIEDLLRIWQKVCEQSPKKLAIIGNALVPEYEKQMHKLCNSLGLSNYVEWFGYVDGIPKYEILKRSRIYLHTTVYDNNGMAAAEGMAAGLPAVAYDLPPLRIPYPKGMIKVPPRNIDAFANAVIELLTNTDLYTKTRKDALILVRDWDWEKRANGALFWLRKNLNLV